jgi:NAD(P)-dependent dehydrogenase (short-subunit alcohol dehydrogenase family)
MFDLKNKVAIVTGSARGIGQAIAIELARHGASVVVSDIIPGQGTVNKIKALKRNSVFIKADMSKKTDIDNLISQTIKKFKKIDILVNNAGIFQPSPTENLKEEDWERTININLRGYFECSQAALRYMLKQKQGTIINIASIAGLFGYSMAAAYCASKGGIVLLTKSLASEYGAKGIRVNAICPGIIETAMTKDILADKKQKQNMIAKLPLKRTGKPIDIAGGAVFLASEAASYITGHSLIIDGGWTCAL